MQEGYIVVPQILGKTALNALRMYSDTLLAKPSGPFSLSGNFERPDYRHPAMVDVLTHQPTLDILRRIGYPHPKIHSSIFSAKPPHSTALQWHRDIYYPYPVAPETDTYTPTELFMLYYSDDTSLKNGCLRVQPGSHRTSQDKPAEKNLSIWALPNEKSVPLDAGDLFIADRNLLHATYANTTDQWRIGLSIAIAPDYANLPEPIQARIVINTGFKGWWPDQSDTVVPKLQALLPTYNGTAAPLFFGTQ